MKRVLLELSLLIRPATPADLPALARSLGHPYLFAERLARQRAGRGTLLIAWLDGTPVGRVYLWVEKADEHEIQERIPGVPLLQHLEVRHDLRNRRIGSALMDAAEQRLRCDHHTQVALGVTLDNHDAMRFYHRRGYRNWGYPPITTMHHEFLANGDSRHHTELCQVFVKDLTGSNPC